VDLTGRNDFVPQVTHGVWLHHLSWPGDNITPLTYVEKTNGPCEVRTGDLSQPRTDPEKFVQYLKATINCGYIF